MPTVRLQQHQVLLLQQLQPLPAPPLLQDLPPVLDQRRSPAERAGRRWLQEEQEEQRLEPIQITRGGRRRGFFRAPDRRRRLHKCRHHVVQRRRHTRQFGTSSSSSATAAAALTLFPGPTPSWCRTLRRQPWRHRAEFRWDPFIAGGGDCRRRCGCRVSTDRTRRAVETPAACASSTSATVPFLG